MNRKNNQSQEKEYLDLWSCCFEDSQQYMDFYFQYKVSRNRIYDRKKDGAIVAMLHANPYTLIVKNQEQLAYYIVGVATKEEYRHQGKMRQLFDNVFLDIWEEKIPFIYLMPAKEKIYLPLGFRTCYQQMHMIFTIEKWNVVIEDIILESKRENKELTFVRYENLSKKEQKIVERNVSIQLKANYDIFTKRDMEYEILREKEMQGAGGAVMTIWQEEQPVSMITYMSENGYVEIVEILHFIEPNCIRKKLKTVYCQSKIETPKIMGRIINVESFLKTFITSKEDLIVLLEKADEKSNEEKLEVILLIKDQKIEKNEGQYYIAYKNKTIMIEKIKQNIPNVVLKKTYQIEELFEIIMKRQRIFLNEIT